MCHTNTNTNSITQKIETRDDWSWDLSLDSQLLSGFLVINKKRGIFSHNIHVYQKFSGLEVQIGDILNCAMKGGYCVEGWRGVEGGEEMPAANGDCNIYECEW